MNGPTLPAARAAAAALLRGNSFDRLPEWRIADDDYRGRSEPRFIAPVCPHPEHEREDAGIYSCCPGPVLDLEEPVIAGYFVALLNADREGAEA
jgi:hypothetical protein